MSANETQANEQPTVTKTVENVHDDQGALVDQKVTATEATAAPPPEKPKLNEHGFEVEEVKPQARKMIFSSDEKKYGKPPATVKIGPKIIAMPPAEQQLAGFEHPEAEEIVGTVRGYKWLEPKGEK